MEKFVLSAGAMLILFLLWGCSENNSLQYPKMNVPKELLKTRTIIKDGSMLFARHCRECHGTRQEGRNLRAGRFNPPAPDFLTSNYAQADPSYLYWRISLGKTVEPFYSQGSVMPAFGPYFSEQQIWQLVAYIKKRAAN